MHRTNIYLTERQEAALDARGVASGSNRSEVIRAILDAELGLDDVDSDLDEALASSAAGIAMLARRLSARDPDLSIDS
ncbi:MAG: hypothetical protein ACRD0Z_08030 [Acidimicrobiales bacterium]